MEVREARGVKEVWGPRESGEPWKYIRGARGVKEVWGAKGVRGAMEVRGAK